MRKFSSKDNFIDVEKLPLMDWLRLLNERPEDVAFIDYMFPTDRHKKEFFDTIASRSEKEIDLILQCFLWGPTTFEADERDIEFIINKITNKDPSQKTSEIERRYLFYKASNGRLPVWDGIKWVLDLLPRSPKQCIGVLSAFLSVYGLILPDGRVDGVLDAMDLIRRRYITTNQKGDEFNTINDREMEKLVYALYKKMGYEAKLTPQKRDGGCDVVISSKQPGRKEKTLIEVKHHNKPIGVSLIRQLMGVVSDSKANKGILITSSTFTKGATKFSVKNSRIEIINGNSLLHLLNEHLGTDWQDHFYRIIEEKQKE